MIFQNSVKKFPLLLALAGGCGCLPHNAAAQVDVFSPYAGPFLTKQDYTYGKDAAWKLLEGPATIGTRQNWTNPNSGNGGTLTLLGVSAPAQGRCRKVKSFVHYKDAEETVTYILNVCKQPDESWKIAE